MDSVESSTMYKSGPTWTPISEEEPSKRCTGKCGRTLAATKFGFKYSTRDGVKGRIRNSNCLDCRKGSTAVRQLEFKDHTKSRISDLEYRVLYLEGQLKEEMTVNHNLQKLFLKHSGEVESLRILVQTLVNKK